MKKISYETLRELNYDGYLLEKAPERVLQFGEGNFLRAFVDYFIDMMNEKAGFNSKVVLVQPISGGERIRDFVNEQEGLYTLFLRGSENGKKVNDKRVISSVSRCLNAYSDYSAYMECAKNPELRFIVCNTTEAGIRYDEKCQFTDRPAESYPAKLTQFLYERYQYFGKERGKGFVILACELIDNNGKELEKCVLQYAQQWRLGESFKTWVKEENIFCSTLVDRIVTGYPRSEAKDICANLGYEDNLIDTGEVFGFWVIEGPESIKSELPFEEAGLPVLITDNHKPYKQRKVRILNGAHTSMVLGAYLAGQDIVRNCMQDDVISQFMNQTIYKEIIPTLSLPQEELMDFAKAVRDRFNNPFIDHSLLAIALNSTAKWKARVLPSLKGYVDKYDNLPTCITASLAFYIAFYKGVCMDDTGFYGMRGQEKYKINDDSFILDFYNAHKEDDAKILVEAVLSNIDFWGENLTEIKGLCDLVIENFKVIETQGAYELMKQCLEIRIPIEKLLEKFGLVPVVVLDNKEDAVPLADALCEAGLPCAEVTFRTEAAEESIRLMTEAHPDMLVGAGTVLTIAQVECAIKAGAKFIVSPGFDCELVDYCLERGIPVFPGCITPSDVAKAVKRGMEVVKFFPAESFGGLSTIKAIAAPYTSIRFMPTGGIHMNNLEEYLTCDKVICCGGSWMVKSELIKEGKFDEIREITEQAVELSKKIRG